MYTHGLHTDEPWRVVKDHREREKHNTTLEEEWDTAGEGSGDSGGGPHPRHNPTPN